MNLISLADIRAAADALLGVAVRTTVVPLCAEFPELRLKLENQQPIGAFKIRGAYYAMSRLPQAQRRRGVVAHSSGNHGQAVAYAAREFGVPAAIVMPYGSVELKVERVRALGAEVVMVPAAERLAAAQRIAVERGMTMIPPYDHPDVIAGQGTVGLEIVEDVPEVAAVLAPVGGGGLLSGVATAVKALRPEVRVVGVEPDLAADARDSLRAGHVVQWPVEDRGRTIADGVRVQVSELTVAHMAARVDDIVTVSEDEILAAVRELAERADVVAEPSGALAAAAWLHHREQLPEGPTVAVVSGGNIDPALRERLMRGDM